MKRVLSLVATVALVLMSSSALAAEDCYQLSADGQAWSRTPELLCVSEVGQDGKADITLKTGLAFNQKTVATFHFDLLQRARCIDCNQDVFGVANPSNSLFNDFKIRFDGERKRTGEESGTVEIGPNLYHYRSVNQ